jgi:protein-S-isoprenylcysteine O-methyltransferase Ste14
MIFVFLDLYFAGTFFINGTLIFLVFAVVVIAGVHYQIMQEESFLLVSCQVDFVGICKGTARRAPTKNQAPTPAIFVVTGH